MINIESICEQCLKKDGCQTYKELKEVTEIYLVDGCEKYIKDVNAVFDKIRAEIAEYKDDKIIHAEQNEMIDIMLEIIDKYRKEGK